MAAAQIISVNPGDAGHDRISQAVKENVQIRISYPALEREYNDVKIGGVVVLTLHKRTNRHNIYKTLHTRGLQRDIDYSLVVICRDGNGHKLNDDEHRFVITRLTDTPMSASS